MLGIHNGIHVPAIGTMKNEKKERLQEQSEQTPSTSGSNAGRSLLLTIIDPAKRTHTQDAWHSRVPSQWHPCPRYRLFSWFEFKLESSKGLLEEEEEDAAALPSMSHICTFTENRHSRVVPRWLPWIQNERMIESWCSFRCVCVSKEIERHQKDMLAAPYGSTGLLLTIVTVSCHTHTRDSWHSRVPSQGHPYSNGRKYFWGSK